MAESEVKKKYLKDYVSYNRNPSVSVKMKGVAVADVKLDESSAVTFTDNTGGEVTMHRVIGKDKPTVVDNKQFIKVYNEIIEKMPKLSNGGIQVLSYVWKRIHKDSDLIVIDTHDVADVFGYRSISSVYNGILNLLEHEILYKAVGEHRYYINVEMFFNGKRVKLDALRALQERLDNKKSDK